MTINRWARGPTILVTGVLAAVLGSVGTARADPDVLGTWSSSGEAWTHRFPARPVDRTVQPVTELGGTAPEQVQPVVAVDATSPRWTPGFDLDLEGYDR